MICSGCGKEEAEYKVTGDNGTTVFMCSDCYSKAKNIAEKEGIPVKEVKPEMVPSSCSQCGGNAWGHYTDKDGYIAVFECLGCGAVYEFEDD